MPDPEEKNARVDAKAVLVDAKSMTVMWMNESASQDFSGTAGQEVGAPVAEAVPLADILGVPAALRLVAETGVAQHRRADLVSTTRGSVAVVASMYRLPDGTLLLLMGHTWKSGRKATAASGPRGDL